MRMFNYTYILHGYMALQVLSLSNIVHILIYKIYSCVRWGLGAAG